MKIYKGLSLDSGLGFMLNYSIIMFRLTEMKTGQTSISRYYYYGILTLTAVGGA